MQGESRNSGLWPVLPICGVVQEKTKFRAMYAAHPLLRQGQRVVADVEQEAAAAVGGAAQAHRRPHLLLALRLRQVVQRQLLPLMFRIGSTGDQCLK